MVDEINPDQPVRPLLTGRTHTLCQTEDQPPVLVDLQFTKAVPPAERQREASAANLVAATEVREAPLPQEKKTILVVDDDASTRGCIARILESQGLSVIQAASIKEAHQKLEQNEVDIILSDKDVPAVDAGLQFAEERPQNIPFILMSGDLTDDLDLQRYGISTALNKPFDFKEVVRLSEEIPRIRIALAKLLIHVLSNTITTILGDVAFLKEYPNDSEYLGKTRKAFERITRFVDSFRENSSEVFFWGTFDDGFEGVQEMIVTPSASRRYADEFAALQPNNDRILNRSTLANYACFKRIHALLTPPLDTLNSHVQKLPTDQSPAAASDIELLEAGTKNFQTVSDNLIRELWGLPRALEDSNP